MQGASFTSARIEVTRDQIARKPRCRIAVNTVMAGRRLVMVRVKRALLLLLTLYAAAAADVTPQLPVSRLGQVRPPACETRKSNPVLTTT